MIKRIKIEAYQVGLLFENRKLIKVLEEGLHWTFGNKNVLIYDMNAVFQAPFELNILLQNEVLASMLEVVEVADNEIVLQFVNGNFKEVLTPGRYAFWKGIVKNEFTRADLSKIEITEDIKINLLENVKMKYFTRKFIVASNDKALLFVNGTFVKELKSGTHYFWNNAITIEVKTVDTRQQQVEISGQELLTKDKAGLRINFFVRYQVVDIMKALLDNKDFEKQLYVAMQLALRAFVGGLTLDELLAKKDTIAEAILAEVTTKIEDLGLTISDAGIRDVILPGDMKEIMNQVLVAEKKAQANSIMRREETAATRSLLNTAKLMEENEMLWKLKEMEYVEKIADKIGEITISGSGNVIGQLKEIFVK
ncbi:regulator of protease activity HflC (stomatin/prohibitin superfamily) [Flavobacterium sp. HSC-32F16]|uniref:slipin family protein n=1 Tax=Flavobacterium sp. HSC-32F16 TaxID=2910964 RepID=UPI0020A3E7DF|nr:slipin family protein [Flavobacterium sp. HSC-32F16]MCP2027895.1 regulator of protease activity HflC (stomatin/prohibitin superfamily) [Flavobacterium sp. HSC-32F16]